MCAGLLENEKQGYPFRGHIMCPRLGDTMFTRADSPGFGANPWV
jgi:hypothetical protein